MSKGYQGMKSMEEMMVQFYDQSIKMKEQIDMVNHPKHYTSDPSGVEAIENTRHRNFNIGNAIKYLWRAGLKEDPSKDKLQKQVEDLRKAVFYINDEIARLTGEFDGKA
jgi:paraquat-inducible protein B